MKSRQNAATSTPVPAMSSMRPQAHRSGDARRRGRVASERGEGLEAVELGMVAATVEAARRAGRLDRVPADPQAGHQRDQAGEAAAREPLAGQSQSPARQPARM